MLTAFAEVALGNVADDGDRDEGEIGDLARKTQNPVADLISLPFQWNVGFDTGPDDRTSSVLIIQPVIPDRLK